MRIDCRDLDCPKPVIKTKEALENLALNSEVEILLNSKISIENVSKFLKSNSLPFVLIEESGFYILKTTKTNELENLATDYCQISYKAIYLKDESTGNKELGISLLSKFLSSFLSMENRPKYIICVNQAVLMTTNRSHQSYKILKELENLGVEILSCGACLEALGLVDKLGVGRISNAFEIMKISMDHDVISL